MKIGDFSSESGVLDPLAASIGEFLRLLLPDDQLHRLELRTLTELESFWRQHHAAYSHVVITGHGSREGYGTASGAWRKGRLSQRILCPVRLATVPTRPGG